MEHRAYGNTVGSGQQGDAGTGSHGDAEKKDSRNQRSDDRGQSTASQLGNFLIDDFNDFNDLNGS
jgi:hypothetical protein